MFSSQDVKDHINWEKKNLVLAKQVVTKKLIREWFYN